MANLEDVARVEYVLDNYDSVEVLKDEKGSDVKSIMFNNKENSPSPLLLYSKKINGTYYTVVAAAENKYKKLWIVTSYIGKNKEDITQALRDEISSLRTTSETAPASLSSENSIPQTDTNVKKKDSTEDYTAEVSKRSKEAEKENSERVTQIYREVRTGKISSAGRQGTVAYAENTALVEKALTETGTSDNMAKREADTVFAVAYTAGLNGEAFDANTIIKTSNINPAVLSQPGMVNSLKLYHMAGISDINAARNVKYWGANSGLQKDDTYRNALKKFRLSYDVAGKLDALGKIMGHKVILVENLKNSQGESANAVVSDSNGTIKINLSADNPILNGAIHEIVHSIRKTDPASYNKLARIVLEVYNEDSPQWKHIKDLYKKQLKGKSEAYASDYVSEETVCKALGAIMQDSEMLNEFVQKDKNLAKKILKDLHDLIVKVSAWVSGDAKISAEQKKTFSKLEKELRAFEGILFEALNKRARAQGGVENAVEGKADERFSIVENIIDNDGNAYDKAVLLDTDFFDGLSPMNWGKQLEKSLKKRIEKSTAIMPIIDEKGNYQMLEFAGLKERASKNGGESHPVLGKLVRSKDNISKLAVIHIDEVVNISEESNPYYTQQSEHGWLDQYGWLHRKAFVINKLNGKIYELTFDIAKTRDGRLILYATNGKIKEVGQTQIGSVAKRAKGTRSHSDYDDYTTKSTESQDKNNERSDLADTEYLELAKDPEKNDIRWDLGEGVDNSSDDEYNINIENNEPNGIEDAVCIIPRQDIVFVGMYRSLVRKKGFKEKLLKAKQGDLEATRELLETYINDEYIDAINKKYSDVILVPVVGHQDTTENKLPLALANAVSTLIDVPVYKKIYKLTSNNMKSKPSKVRLTSKMDFDFYEDGTQKDIAGKHFVLVDDVVSTGTTLTALKDFIKSNGGVVDGYIALAKGKDSSDDLAILSQQLKKLVEIAKQEDTGILEKITEEELYGTFKELTARQAETAIRNPRIISKILDERGRRGHVPENVGKSGLADRKYAGHVTEEEKTLRGMEENPSVKNDERSDLADSEKDDIRWDLGEDDLYTEEEYYNYGWARANDILSKEQNEEYRSHFAMAVLGREKYPKTKKKEFIIPVGDTIFDGVKNVLVFCKGTIDKPIITSIIEIYEYDETTLDKTRRYIYGLERRGIQQKTGQIIRRYYADDFGESYDVYKQNYLKISGHNNGERLRGSDSEETSRASELRGIEERYDLADDWNEKIDKFGTVPKGENPARDIDVPNKIRRDRPISRFARTMMEAGVTPKVTLGTCHFCHLFEILRSKLNQRFTLSLRMTFILCHSETEG